MTEKASEIVTERGRPSGMATTITIIPRMKNSTIVNRSFPVYHYLEIPFTMANRISKTRIIVIAEYNPNLPISVASFSNFC